MLKKYSWQILCCIMLIIILILGYHNSQNKEAVQKMIEREVYGDLLFLHSFIEKNELNNWEDPDSVGNRLLKFSNSTLQVANLLYDSSYSSFEYEQILLLNLYEELSYSIDLAGTKEGELIFSQLKNYLEEAKITNDQSLDIDYEESIKRLEHLIELLRQD